VKLAEAFGIRGLRVSQRADLERTIREARATDGPALVDFQVEQEDSVYPMIPAGKALHEMIRRPSPIAETAGDP
jgi:acetolactate synthase-1/2/3 large subunit